MNKVFFRGKQVNEIDTPFGKLKLLSLRQEPGHYGGFGSELDLSNPVELKYECGLVINAHPADVSFISGEEYD